MNEHNNHERIINHLQCEAITKTGKRCKNRTVKSTMCWVHLKQLKQLRIKQTNVKEANLGLFTTKQIKRNQKITDYTGKVYDHPVNGKYVLEVSKKKFIDANNSKDIGGYANS